jgi:hypothetical protein
VSGVLNNAGAIADTDYTPDRPNVVVIGNSFVQASALPASLNLHSVLNRQISASHAAYGFAQPGGKSADYVEIARWSAASFRPQAFAILLVEGDLDYAEIPRAGSSHFRLTPDGIRLERVDRTETPAWLHALMEIRLTRYMFDNLSVLSHLPRQFWRGSVRPPPTPVRPPVPPPDPRADGFAQAFLDSLASVAGVPPRAIVLLVDGDRTAIHRGSPSSRGRDIDRIAQIAERQGFTVRRLDDAMRAEFAATGKRLDFSPADSHWNARAHALAARELQAALAQLDLGVSSPR